MKLLVVGLGIVLYLLSAGISYATFSYFRPGVATTTTVSSKNGTTIKTPTAKYAGLPKTEACPLNGVLYSQQQKTDWEKRRPLGIMVENSSAARPQSGLSSADVIYEAMAEGGITRFLTVFYCNDVDTVGPVRSARTYYLDWISEYGSSPLYAHVGGANTPGPADALGQIGMYGWGGYNDMDQFSIGFPAFWRDYNRLGADTATEHTVYTSTAKLWDFAASKRKLTSTEVDDQTGKTLAWNTSFVPWIFKDDVSLDTRPQSSSVEFGLSNTDASYMSDYVVRWQYDRDSNSYLRFNGGKAHLDMNTGQQLLAKDVILQFEVMSIADDNYNEEGHGLHTLYADKGTGKAKFLIDGIVSDGTWAKKSRLDRTHYYDANGTEIKFNRGQIWVETLPIGQTVTIK